MSTVTMRSALVSRVTRETQIELSFALDGTGTASVSTGIPFYDHLLTALTLHARIDLSLQCKGDLEIDDHHTVEDCAIALGSALNEALGDRSGIARFGHAYAPLDESLSRAVIDCSGRPFARISLGLRREQLGALSCENISHALTSFATAAKITLHVDAITGDNDHHRAESAFKAVALALRAACKLTNESIVPSSKGVLT